MVTAATDSTSFIVSAAAVGGGLGMALVVCLAPDKTWSEKIFPSGFLATTLIVVGLFGALSNLFTSSHRKFIEFCFYSLTLLEVISTHVIMTLQTDLNRSSYMISEVLAIALVVVSIIGIWNSRQILTASTTQEMQV